jgi:hypothetical protein
MSNNELLEQLREVLSSFYCKNADPSLWEIVRSLTVIMQEIVVRLPE